MIQNDNFWSLRAIEHHARRHPIVCPTQSGEYYNAFLYENPTLVEILISILNDFKPKLVVKSITLDRINSYSTLGQFKLSSISGEFIFDRIKFLEKMKSFRYIHSDYFFPAPESLVCTETLPDDVATVYGDFVERFYGHRHLTIGIDKTDEEKCICYADLDQLLISTRLQKEIESSAFELIEYSALLFAYQNYFNYNFEKQKELHFNQLISAFGEEFRSIIASSLHRPGLDLHNRTAMAIRELERQTGLPHNPRGKWKSVPENLAGAFNGGKIVNVLWNSQAARRTPASSNEKGIAFEWRVADAFAAHGFAVSHTATTGDFGVDLITERNNLRICVQCKDYTALVGVSSVQEVFAGTRHYGASWSVVVAANGFTRQAHDLAVSLGVKLALIQDIESSSSIDTFLVS